MRNTMTREMDEHILKRLACILGEFSAAAKALADLQRRKEGGEDAAVYQYGSTFLVGPRTPPPPPPGATQ